LLKLGRRQGVRQCGQALTGGPPGGPEEAANESVVERRSS